MLRSITEDIRFQFASGNMITRIVIINVAVFIAINLLYFFSTHLNAGNTPRFYTEIVHYLSVSSNAGEFFLRPWTWLTSMFLHQGFWHILWNMLFLYWFGRIAGDLIGDHRILPIYIVGGLAGALAFFLSANLLGYTGSGPAYALGASGAVMALVTAAGVLAPEYRMRLILIGEVKLKWVVLALIFLDLIGTASDRNTGGHFAHLGGVLMGWVYIVQLRDGRDIGAWVNQVRDWIAGLFAGAQPAGSRPSRIRVVHRAATARGDRFERTQRPSDFQAELDRILDKIKAEGYDSLTEEEKDFLYQASNKD